MFLKENFLNSTFRNVPCVSNNFNQVWVLSLMIFIFFQDFSFFPISEMLRVRISAWMFLGRSNSLRACSPCSQVYAALQPHIVRLPPKNRLPHKLPITGCLTREGSFAYITYNVNLVYIHVATWLEEIKRKKPYQTNFKCNLTFFLLKQWLWYHPE